MLCYHETMNWRQKLQNENHTIEDNQIVENIMVW